MRIINTFRRSKVKSQNSKVKAKNQRSKVWIIPLIIGFWALGILISHAEDAGLENAESAVQQSQEYYQKAVDIYKDLIKRGKDLNELHLKLGSLYYNQGDFKAAIDEFKKSLNEEAKKLLAISYYRLGDFTDAIDAFNKNKLLDDESRFYLGMTAEKLNLFDKALDVYKKIKDKKYLDAALERINSIEKQVNLLRINELDASVAKIIANSPREEEYPQAGALVLLADENIEVTPQNTMVSQMHYVVKILNERGKENFSESQIEYDSTFEKVEIEYARTIKPDGTVADVGSRHIRDVSKYLNFPLYSNARVRIISFPEITEGAVIEYKVRVYRNELINKKDFVLSYQVQAAEPVIKATFRVSLPKERQLNLKILNEKYNNFGANLKPEIDKDGLAVYTWQFEKIPQIIPESNMPPVVEINPTMAISTFFSWEEIYKWWWSLAENKIKADAAIKNKISELVRNKKSGLEKIKAIYNFCAKEIRYVAVEYGQAGYEPHKAEDIFKNKYGDCKDQAILLVTMLREAGFKANPVLISTKDYYNLNEDFPSMLFNHTIAMVDIDGRNVFMDATADTCSFDDLPSADQARQVLVFNQDGYKILPTPLYPAEHNLLRQSLFIDVNPQESIKGKRLVLSYGVYDQAQRYWLLYTPPELVGEALKEKIQGVSIGAKLIKYDANNLNDLNTPVILEYYFSGEEYFTNAGDLRIMPQLANLDTTLIAKDKRKYALDFEILDYKEANFEVAIPANFVVKYMPESIIEDSPWLKASVEYSQAGNKIFLKQKTILKKKTIAESEYPAFKVFFEGLAKKIKQRVVLEKKR